MDFDPPEDKLRAAGGTELLPPLSDTPIPPPDPDTRLQLVWFDDILPCLDVLDFVQGILVEQSAVVVFGESNAGKTFWLLDLALHVATGRSWCGRRVEHGGVVYCALEGTKGFRIGWQLGEAPTRFRASRFISRPFNPP